MTVPGEGQRVRGLNLRSHFVLLGNLSRPRKGNVLELWLLLHTIPVNQLLRG